MPKNHRLSLMTQFCKFDQSSRHNIVTSGRSFNRLNSTLLAPLLKLQWTCFIFFTSNTQRSGYCDGFQILYCLQNASFFKSRSHIKNKIIYYFKIRSTCCVIRVAAVGLWINQLWKVKYYFLYSLMFFPSPNALCKTT